VKLASRGQRDMDDGPEAINDPAERAQVQRQARQVYLESLTTAVALTAVSLLIG
jgi:hypothetical protein